MITSKSITLIFTLATAALAGAQNAPLNVPPTDVPTTGMRVYNMDEAPAKSQATTETKQHYLSVQLFSIIPEQGIESFEGTPAPGAFITGIGGMTGPAYTDSSTRFGVHVSPIMKQGRYGAQVKVTPWVDPGNLIKAQTFEVDLSDMKTTSIELARNNEGRVYLLNLTPSVQIHTEEPPKSVNSMAKELGGLKFEKSAMILNNDEFLGTMTGNGGEKGFLDIPGRFKVEFALIPFRDAEVFGKLDDGVLNVRKSEDQQITIYNVMSDKVGVLPDGPYKVWARWNPPSQSAEEAIAQNLAAMEKMREEGVPMSKTPGFAEAIRKLKSGKPNITHGLGGIPLNERVLPD